MLNFTIREIRKSEIPLLQDFLYEAIFQRDTSQPLSRDIINQAELRIYIDHFGKANDHCLVAEVGTKIIGAVWTRILSGPIKGYGYLDDDTPQFTISLYKEYRGQGVGTALMQAMLRLLRQKGYKQASLSVQKDNYAAKMYQDLGFTVFKESEEEYLMVYSFQA